MSNKRISTSDIVVDQPLLWNVYGSDGALLFRRGFVISNAHQVEIFIQRGLFVDANQLITAAREKSTSQEPIELPSVVRIISQVRSDLRRLSYNLASEADASSKLLAIAKQVMIATYLDTDVALGCILLHQDGHYSVCHCVDVAIVALVVGRTLKKSQEELLVLVAAALTMNVSMLREQECLQEGNDSLSVEDQAVIFRHPQQSVDQLRAAGVQDEHWLSWILNHHENEDGSGYPMKHQGVDIPQNAKIISLADRYCERVRAHSYRKALLPNAALRDILIENKGSVDANLVTLFIRELGTYPIGTFVKLENGEIGVVTSKGSTITTPCVHSLIGLRGAPLTTPIKRDTQKKLLSIREVLHRDQVPIRFTMWDVWGEVAAV